MVREQSHHEDRVMTETPQQHDEQTRPGVAAENLRNYERLRRSTTDRKIAGVAGGLGRHLNIDPTVLRVLFVVLALFGGAGLVLYGVAWLIVPEEGTDRSVIQTSPSTRNAVLIVVGVIAALLVIGDSWDGVGFPWPLAIIAVVIVVWMVNRDRSSNRPAGPDAPGAPYPDQYAATGGPAPEGTLTMSDTSTSYPPPSGPPSGPAWQAPPTPYQPPPPKVDRGPTLFGPTLALIAIALGSLGLYDTGHDVATAAYAALALAIIGVMLLVGSVAGRPGGLIFLGIVASLALAVTSAVDGNWTDDREIDAAPLLAANVRDGYNITAGEIRLDLTDVTNPERLDGRTLALHAEAGEIVVVVPDGMDVDVNADIRFGGEIDVAGHTESGNGVSLSRHIEGGDGVPQLDLQIDLLVGHIQVTQEDAP
jgi:phage shock protein PspC (stress-responsive transcriptional regulator)